MSSGANFPFKINLRGIIDLLSQHLYSGPQVYLRELLQNGVDAIRARERLEKGFRGHVRIEVINPRKGNAPPTLIFIDDGIGLTEEEIHQFLATIGESSKRGEISENPEDFIGQFGIGLLSCFVVSDEIVVLTRSARDPSAPAIEWRGRPDGTYSVKVVESVIEPGTQVYLTCKPGSEEFFEVSNVRRSAQHYGGLLPYPIRLIEGQRSETLNAKGAPWRRRFATSGERTTALLNYGRETFEIDFLDAIPLQSRSGKLDGVAFVLPFSPSLATKQSHRVYLKNMLLSEAVEGLVPDWAFFVKCVINTSALRPTASRESFCEDEALESARNQLGSLLREYLVELSQTSPARLGRLIDLHALSIKSLALHDDEFYRLFINWIVFDTSSGRMTLAEYREANDVVRYTPDLDEFRQIAHVAAAQGQCIINAGYVHDADLLARLPDVIDGATVKVVGSADLAQEFDELDLDERDEVHAMLEIASRVLRPFHCAADVKKFRPESLPTLYGFNAAGSFFRSMEQSKEAAGAVWSTVLGNLSRSEQNVPRAHLYFNYRNPLVRKIARLDRPEQQRRAIEMLYVQSLLLGHQPLNAREMALLNQGLLGLIEWGVSASGGSTDAG